MAEKPRPAVIFPAGCFAPQAHVRIFQGADPAPGKSLGDTMAQDDGSASALVQVPVGTQVCAVGRPPKGGDKMTFRAIAGQV